MKNSLFVCCAFALLELATACVDPVAVNPNYNGDTKTVTTQFVLNIAPAYSDMKTKQSDTAVQMTGRFRGLNNASLLTFSLDADGKKISDITDPDMLNFTSYIDLSETLSPGSIDTSGTNMDGTSVPRSRRILQIDLPVGTNTLVFYGQAITGNSMDKKNDFGVLGYQTEGLTEKDMSKIGCWAGSRIERNSTKAANFIKIEDIIETVYDSLFTRRYTFDTSVDFEEYHIGGKTINWSDYTIAYVVDPTDVSGKKKTTGKSPIPRLLGLPDVTATPYEVALAQAYQAFTDYHADEYRAGSGDAVLRQMSDLYRISMECVSSPAINDLEKIAKYMFGEIKRYLDWFFVSSANSMSLTAWKTVSSGDHNNPGVVEAIQDSLNKTDITAPTVAYPMEDFPYRFDLPIGAATMARTEESIFYHYNRENMSLLGGGTMSIYDYTYPPSLVYYGNAPVRVSNSNSFQTSEYPDGASAWEANGSWNKTGSTWETGFSHVTASTRGVAMAYNIQYGNALLDTKVKYSDEVLGTDADTRGLADNDRALNGDLADNVFYPDVAEDGIYPTLVLTGILVGGQPSKVGWNYLPVENAEFNKMVYDKHLNNPDGTIDESSGVSTYQFEIPHTKTNGNVNTTPSNYTLLFDNYDSQVSGGRAVLVCLEFRNNLGKDFWGQSNMVRQGGTFYILGQLQITDAMRQTGSDPFAWNVSKIMPPYNPTTGTTLTGDPYLRVFMQDHKTKVTFSIGHDSLKHAYVTVPDLRSATLSFGLSVDLTWEDGLDFGEIKL